MGQWVYCCCWNTTVEIGFNAHGNRFLARYVAGSKSMNLYWTKNRNQKPPIHVQPALPSFIHVLWMKQTGLELCYHDRGKAPWNTKHINWNYKNILPLHYNVISFNLYALAFPNNWCVLIAEEKSLRTG